MLCKLFISSSLEEAVGFLSFEDFNKVLCGGTGGWGFPDGASDKDLACQCGGHETLGFDLGQKDSLEEAMATHSSILAWRIPRRVSDAIQPSHPLSSASPPAPNPSQHQGLFQ